MLLKILAILQLVTLATAKFRFDNYTLYKILPNNVEQVRVLQELEDKDSRFDFWSDPVPSAEPVSVLSSPADKSMLEEYLKSHGIDFSISFSNIQEIIDSQIHKPYTRGNDFAFDSYHTNDEINAWIDDIVATYPEVSPLVGGVSLEGREIRGFKISHGTGRRIIFIEGGIHSREWISPATIIFMTNELLTSDDEWTRAAAREYDWYIFPVTNPDGYVWTHTEFRLWRKNRRPIAGTNEFGIDLNRNWNNNWLVIGASTNPSSNTYAGLGPFSEPETRTLSDFIRTVGHDMDIYLSFHSSGQLLLLPYGNTTEPLSNYYDAMQVGRRAMGALSVRYGTQYVTGNIAEAIYHAAGSSVDWVKDEFNTPLAYVYELRDRGQFGHLLPPDQIIPTGQETWDSVLEMIHQGKRFGLINGLPESNDLTESNDEADPDTSVASGLQASVAMMMIVGFALLRN